MSNEIEIELEECLQIALDWKGIIYNETEAEAPAARITLIERVQRSDTGPIPLDYRVRVEAWISLLRMPFCGWDPCACEANRTAKLEEQVFKTKESAFAAGLKLLREELHKRFEKASEEAPNFALQIARLRNVVNDHCVRTLEQLEGKKVVSFDYASGADLFLCLTVLHRHFPRLSAHCGVLFRFRTELDKDGDRQPWTAGKNREGDPVVKLGEAARISGEKAEYLRGALGFAPAFMVTFCAEAWENMLLDEKEFLIHHELCHCGFDGEKPFMVTHSLEEFSETVAALGLAGAPKGRAEFIAKALLGIAENGQIDLFTKEIAPAITEANFALAEQMSKAMSRTFDKMMQAREEEARRNDPDFLEGIGGEEGETAAAGPTKEERGFADAAMETFAEVAQEAAEKLRAGARKAEAEVVEVNPFAAGMDAYNEGHALSDNPFAKGSAEAREWTNGFNSAIEAAANE
jgi:hypothetical protein